MKTGFSYWGNRIAPVFDTSRNIHIIGIESDQIVYRAEDLLTEEIPLMRVRHLCNLEVDTLVCGAISRQLHNLISSCGIRVIPFVAGDLDDVVQAWLDKQLEAETFRMPGCRRRCGLQKSNGKSQGQDMNGQRRGGRGQNGGQNQLDSGAGKQGRSGRRQATTANLCSCPNCGHSEAHERGIPCGQKRCPACGSALIRQ